MLTFAQFYLSQLQMYFINLEMYYDEKWITIHLKINGFFFSIYIFCCFAALSMPLILIAWDFVSMYFSHSQKGKKYLFCNWVMWWADIYNHLQPSFFQARMTWYSNLVRNILQLLWLQEEVQLKCHVKMKTYLRKKMHQILTRTLYEVS